MSRWWVKNLRGGRPWGMSRRDHYGGWTPGPLTIFVLLCIFAFLVGVNADA